MIPFMTVLKAYTELNGELSVAEQVLFFRLFLINNKAGWAEWFGADNRRLMLDTGIKSEHTIISARNSLKQKGIIDFVSGKKGQPTRYTLTTVLHGYTAKNTATNAVQKPFTATIAVNTAVKSAVNNAVKSAGIKDLETRDIETAAAAASDEHGIKEVMAAFSENIHPVTGEIERDMLVDFCESYGCQWTLEAIREAVASNGFSLKYIGAILKRWQAQGFQKARLRTIDGGKQQSAQEPQKHDPLKSCMAWAEPFIE